MGRQLFLVLLPQVPTRVFLGPDCEDAITYIFVLVSYLQLAQSLCYRLQPP